MRNAAGIVGIVFGAIFLCIGLFVGGIFAILGSVFRQSGYDNEKDLEYYKEDGIKVKGVVTEADDGTTVEYEDENGEVYSIHYNLTSSSYYEGQKMEVYYYEDNPDDAIVPELAVSFNIMFGNIFFFVGIGIGGVFGIIGLIALICGIVGVSKAKKQGNDNNADLAGALNQFSAYNAGSTPVITNDIPVDVSVNYSGKSNLSGVDKNLF